MRILGLKGVTGFLSLRDKQTDMIVPNRLVARFFVPDLLTALSYMSCLAALRNQGNKDLWRVEFFCQLMATSSRLRVDRPCLASSPGQLAPPETWANFLDKLDRRREIWNRWGRLGTRLGAVLFSPWSEIRSRKNGHALDFGARCSKILVLSTLQKKKGLLEN